MPASPRPSRTAPGVRAATLPGALRRSRAAKAAALALLAALVACAEPSPDPAPAASQGWPQWRGPGGQGIAAEVALPVEWSRDGPAVRWKAAVPGEANSSPIVAGGRVVLTSAEAAGGEIARLVVAVDAGSGEIAWTTEVFRAPPEKKHALTSYATPTPATDGERVYAYFGSTLAALDLDGAILWSREVDPGYLRYSRYGAASSPLVVGGKIIVFQDREFGDTEDRGWLAAFDAATGAELWRTEWDDTCCSYAPPLYRGGARPQLVLFHSASVAGHDPETGARLWSHPHTIVQPVPSLAASGDLLIAVGGTHKKGAVALRLAGEGERTTVEELWTSAASIPGMASPVLYRGRLFVVSDHGVLTCYEAASGEVVWKRRLARGNYRSSLLAGDGKVYATSSEGVTSVVAADAPRFELLAENDLGPVGDASPAVGGGCLLVRTVSHLYCIETGPAS